MMMSRNMKLIVGFVAVVAAGALLWIGLPSQPAQAPTLKTATAAVEIQIPGAASPKQFEAVPLSEGATALTITQAVVPVNVSGEGANAFVTAIDGYTAQDAAREFWLLKINGEKATVGAGSYSVQPDDLIRWEINTY